MWLYTTFGFFSVVKAYGDNDMLMVRSRVRSDLERLQEMYLPSMSEITTSPERDYRYRGMVNAEDLAVASGDIVRDITYNNFKSAVGKTQGQARAHIYSDVWGVNLEMEAIDRAEQFGVEAPAKPLTKSKNGAKVSPKQKAKQVATEPDVIIVRKNRGAWKAGR